MSVLSWLPRFEQSVELLVLLLSLPLLLHALALGSVTARSPEH